MRRLLSLLPLALLAGALPAVSADAAAPTARAATTSRPSVAVAVVHELNRVRARSSLPSLRLDDRMSRSASSYSGEMARSRRVGHGPWSTRVARAAGGPDDSGEVIGWLAPASPQQEATAIVRAWLNSPIHRRVVLDADFRRAGVGRADGVLGGIDSAIYTVDFASAR